MTLTTVAERLVNEMMTELTTQLPPGCIERGVGTIALLSEIPIAAAASDRGVLSEASLRNLTIEAAELVRTDPGMGPKFDRSAYAKQLKSARTAHARTSAITLLSSNLPMLNDKYLGNWQLHLDDLETSNSGDFAGYRYSASRIIAHMVCAGLSIEIIRNSLHFLITSNIEHNASRVIEEFVQRLDRGPKLVKALLFVEQTISLPVLGVNWMTVSQAREWAEQHELTEQLPTKFHGALPITGNAWDKWHLQEMVSTVRSSVIDRVRAISGDEIKISLTALVDAFDGIVKLNIQGDNHPRAARYRLPQLTLSATDSSQPLEVAMDFYTAAVRANGHAARATLLWAALEVLFSEPGIDNLECANYAANFAATHQTRRLVGISMKMLGDHRGDPVYAATAATLSGESEYEAFVDYLKKHDYSGIQSAQCFALMKQVAIRVTGRGMITYRDSTFNQLRHLYRQRNLAVHGGITDSPLMAAISFLSEPTVAAVINQVASTGALTRDDLLRETGTEQLSIDRIRVETEDKDQKSDRILSYAELFV